MQNLFIFEQEVCPNVVEHMSLIIVGKTVSSLLLNVIEQLQLENKYHLFLKFENIALSARSGHQTSQQESQGVSV